MRQLLILLTAGLSSAVDLPPNCEKPVYCNSRLLHHVQMARIFNDSKTFVDLHMKYNETKTLNDFEVLLNDNNQRPSVSQLETFVEDYFSNESELEEWKPADHSDNPSFLDSIKDEELRAFGKDLNDIWPVLAKKVKAEVLENPEQYSLIPITNGFIIPGGRFTEIYYWDSYWIIEGLLISGMKDTARGMIENLIELLIKFGHVPNGSTWYYQERSQPPMLTAMVAIYHQYTQDIEFVRNHIACLENEMDFWLKERAVTVEKDGSNHTLLRYFAPSKGPRPESYFEDYSNSIGFSDKERKDFYIDIKSAAESGWDFSSRWFIKPDGSNNGSLTDIHTRYIIPADLNAIFAGALQHIAFFYDKALRMPRKASHWGYLASRWRASIEAVLWSEENAMWYDYNIRDRSHRKYFYTSNLAPLWQNAVDASFLRVNGPRIVDSLEKSGALDFPGGVPTSLTMSGEQWDFPNVWAPEVSIVVNAIDNIGTTKARAVALDIAQTFVRSCYLGFQDSERMYEKYDAENPGETGGGGEYNGQFGFGWTNGAVLEFLHKYGSVMTASDNND